jgi:deazaflavin-dependent oxidoreductase (nitroreductase family)
MADTEPDERAAAIRAAARVEAPGHRRLLQTARAGHLLSEVMRRGYVFGVPAGHAVLTTTGRRSGQPRPTCIRAVRSGGRLYAVMLRPPDLALQRPLVVSSWVHNIRADPRVRVRLGRRTLTGTAREITSPSAEARAIFCDTVHLIDYGECTLHLRGRPTRAKIQDLHRYWFDTGIALVIDLDS